MDDELLCQPAYRYEYLLQNLGNCTELDQTLGIEQLVRIGYLLQVLILVVVDCGFVETLMISNLYVHCRGFTMKI
jgi:hypothetical protein